MTRRSSSRPLVVALTLSLVLHLLLGLSFGRRWFAAEVDPALAAQRPDPIRFELVETPESASRDEPALESEFYSNRNTRSQQLRPPEDDRAVNRRPQVRGDGELHDLRPTATAPNPGLPDPVARAPVPPTPPAPKPSPAAPDARQQVREATTRESAVQMRERPEAELPVPRRAESEAAAKPAPESRAREQTPPAAPPQTRQDRRDPSALVTDERVAAGRPGLSSAEEEELARAEALGEFSYEATRHFFADYFFDLKEKVENTWIILLSTRYRNLDPSKAALTFKIYPNGSIGELRLLSGEAEGDDLFPLVCSLAVRNSAPFGPVPYDAAGRLPENVRGLPLNVRMNFTYN